MKLPLIAGLIVGTLVFAAEHPAARAQEPEKKTQADEPAQQIDDVLEPIAPTTVDPVERVISGMRDAQKRIEERNTGAETRTIQEDVVKNLEKLIELAQQQQQAGSSAQQQQPDENSDADREQQPQETAAPPPAGDRDRPGENSRPQERPGSPRNKDARFEFRTLTREVWGHLPEKVRQRLSNRDTDKSVPKYSDLVYRYFEALAEESRREGEAK